MNSLGPSPGALAPGTILGAFEVLSTLGRGGMGAVYRVRNRITGDQRALKVILPELAAQPQFVDRFVREIRLAMAVDHPNLVRVFEPGMDGDRMFLPMELLLGESLATRLKRERCLTVDAALELLRSIGSALSALHARGILHRDVKPSNIFLAQEAGQIVPKLLDLGAGKEVGGSDEMTSTGLAIGSPHYMAPEQASGRKDVDVRVDQYALAVVAYQLFTGARPYENDDTGHVLAKVLSGAPYRMPRELRPDIPAGVEAAVLRAMNRDRDARFPSVDAFVSALGSEVYEPSGVRGFEAPRPAVVPEAAPGRANAGVEPSGTIGAAVVPAPVRSPSKAQLWAGIGAAVVTTGVVLTIGISRLVGAPSLTSTATRSTDTPPPPVDPVAALPTAPTEVGRTAPAPLGGHWFSRTVMETGTATRS
jgi:serine/threonine protein kinase